MNASQANNQISEQINDLGRAERRADLAGFLFERSRNAAAINISGDLVVRDKIHHGTAVGSEPLPQVVLKATLERYLRFAAPRCLDDVRTLLTKRLLVVLVGPPGWGKQALGMNLLGELCEQLHTLDPDTDLRALGEHLSERGGYLVDGLASRQLRELTAVDLDRLVDRLENSKALLVLTVKGDADDVRTNELRELIPDLGDPPDLRDVLISQLRGLASETKVQSLIADETVLDQLSRCQSASAAQQLALDLTGSTASSNADELSARQALQQRTEVEKWLGQCGDAYWPYLFSTAVLDGLRRDLVVKGGADIARSGKVEPLPGTARVDLFELLRTRSSMGEWRVSHGVVHAQRVQFHQWEHQPWVLELVWHHGTHLRDPMLRWLRQLGKHDEQKVRFAAGAAVGQLMVNEFPVFSPVLHEWADFEEEPPREAAVAAVMVAAGDEKLRKVLQTVVTRWAITGSAGQKWTAARVCGRPLGRVFPDTAFRLLKSFARSGSAQLLFAVSQSIVELAEDAEDHFFSRLLSTVHEWTTQADEKVRTAGVFAFLQMCVDLVDAPSALPRLLVLTSDSAEQVKDLWRVAIVHPGLHQAAVKTAALWARLCEIHPEGPARLADFFSDIPRWSRHRTVLQLMATSWKSGGRTFPLSAAAVLSALTGPGERESR